MLQKKLHSTVDKIAAPLAYFDDLAVIGEKLGLPLNADVTAPVTRVPGVSDAESSVDVDSPELIRMLCRVDECIDFLVQHVRRVVRLGLPAPAQAHPHVFAAPISRRRCVLFKVSPATNPGVGHDQKLRRFHHWGRYSQGAARVSKWHQP